MGVCVPKMIIDFHFEDRRFPALSARLNRCQCNTPLQARASRLRPVVRIVGGVVTRDSRDGVCGAPFARFQVATERSPNRHLALAASPYLADLQVA